MRRCLAASRAAVALLAGIAATACRDAVSPWTPAAPPPDTAGTLRLTWSSGNDLHPRWTAGGDSIVYAGDGFPGLPLVPGLLLRIPSSGGSAGLLIPALQFSAAIARRLSQPSLSPGGDRIAFFELAAFRPPSNLLNPDTCRVPEPRLDSVVLHIRSPVVEASFRADLPLRMAGIDPAQRLGLPGPYAARLFAFQQAVSESGDLLLRADWSPDGERLVFSDGLRLLTWGVNGDAPTPVPGTEHGVSPAWSPDGQWIAFTRLSPQSDSARTVCSIRVGRNVETQYRWTYTFAPRLVLIHPDGTGATDVGPGHDPVWGADGSLFFSDGRVRRRSPAGQLSDVADTEGGRWPSPSPAGERLAFVRADPSSGFDLWVVRLAR